MAFTHPWLLLLLACLPLAYLLAVRRLPGRTGLRGPRGPWPAALLLRLLVVGALVLALAGLQVPGPPRAAATVFVVDLSDSVPLDIQEQAKHWVRDALAARGPDDLAGVVAFGREARVELPLGKHADHATWGTPPGDGSALAAALRLGAALLPPAGGGHARRLVVLTDGNETQGDALAALLRPELQGVEVATVPLPAERQLDVALTQLAIASALRAGEQLEARVTATAAHEAPAVLRLWLNDDLISETSVHLNPGPNEFTVEYGDPRAGTALALGFYAVRATITPERDSRPENNTAWGYTVVGDAARVLVVEGAAGAAAAPSTGSGQAPSAGAGQALAAALATQGIHVDTAAAAALPTTTGALQAYDAVVLANVSAEELTPAQLATLQSYVADLGRGLVAAGGDQSFALGHYAGTALEETLPVRAAPRDPDRAASLALLVVFDRSGSMGEGADGASSGGRRVTRLDLAKEGTIRAAETLKEGDLLGVLAFDDKPQQVVPIAPVRGAADLRAVAARVGAVSEGGGTNILAAVQEAFRELRAVEAQIKHVVLLTDGDDSSSPAVWGPLIAQMRRARITVSTVGIGYEAGVPLLQRIATLGGGRHHFAARPEEVPQIVTQETRAAANSLRQDREFRPRLAWPGPALRGLFRETGGELPPLYGFVRTAPKPGAEVLLAADTSEPVLAQWQYGLGRAAAWTADLWAGDDGWARDWVARPDWARFWAQLVRWTMPAPADADLQIGITVDGAEAAIVVESVDAAGAFRNLHGLQADVAGPLAESAVTATALRVPLRQTAPGRYEGRVPVPGPGAYAVRVTQTAPDGTEAATRVAGFAVPYGAEHAAAAVNRQLLQRLAAETGAPAVARPQDAYRAAPAAAREPQPAWRFLLALALVLFVADVAVRRLRPTPADARWLAGGLARRLQAAGARAVAALVVGAAALPRQLHPLRQPSRRRRGS